MLDLAFRISYVRGNIYIERILFMDNSVFVTPFNPVLCNPPLRVGIIGLGNRGRQFIGDMIRSKSYEIITAYDSNAKVSEACIREFPFLKSALTKSFDEAINREEIEIVFLVTPDFTHEELGLKILNSGKHLMCEKPLAITTEGCKRLLKAAENAKRKIILGFVLRYAPIFQNAWNWLNYGKIGKLCTVWANHSVGSGSPWFFHSWHSKRENVTSLLLQKGSHDLDIISWFVNDDPIEVFGYGNRYVFGGDKPNDLLCLNCDLQADCQDFWGVENSKCAFRKEIDLEDNHQIIIKFKNGVTANYNECHFTPNDNREFCFIGTEGRIDIDVDKGKLIYRSRFDRAEVIKDFGHLECHADGDSYLLKDVIDCIRFSKEAIADERAGLISVAIGESAAESINSGTVQPVRV